MGFIGSILVLSFLVFFHELGHFLAAKLFGVRVDAFSIGFGKTKLFKKQIGETEYSLRPIPLGGFVSLKGQSDSDPTLRNTDKDSIYGIALWKRLVILAAGSFFNILLAFLLFCAAFGLGRSELAPVVGSVAEGSAAAKSGILKGDEIIKIDNKTIKSWDSLSKAVAESSGSLSIEILRNGEIVAKNITPEIGKGKNIFGEEIKRPLLGISASGESSIVSYNFVDSVILGFKETLESSKLILQSIEKLIFGVVPLSEIGGVVSIVSITAKATELGIVVLFTFSALISVNLGILNLLPIPALDGGHIIFTLYEMIFKKAPSESAMYRLTLLGWGILLALMCLGLYNDILRILNGSMPF
ncbi:MAG: RIP metalloprotease RseP [Helicobacteraceae bacterium]|nr:RIP metalloprotease RseP [Helicobacteraceae bacterium]